MIPRNSIVVQARESDVRNILIVGITGSGKSTLTNVLTNTNDFEESGGSVGKTEDFQKSEIFEWQGKRYRVIDNVGFSDAGNFFEKDLLTNLEKGVSEVGKKGINQVLFVFKGRFSKSQIIAFNILKDILKDFVTENEVTKFITIVRTVTNFKINARF